MLGNEAIIQKFRTLRSQIDYGIFYPVQDAAIAALNLSLIHISMCIRDRTAAAAPMCRVSAADRAFI